MITEIKSININTFEEKINLVHRSSNIRIRIILFISIILMLILIYKLVYLQIIKYHYYKNRSEINRLRVIPIPAIRGEIYDRYNKVLAANKLSYSLLIYPSKLSKEKLDEVLNKLSSILKISKQELENKVKCTKNDPIYPVYLQRNIDPKTMAVIVENQLNLPGIEISKNMVRYYPNKNLGVHTIGYTGEITAQELEILENEGYKQGDIIGKMGLERTFDSYIKGKEGNEFVEVDVLGRPIKSIKKEPPLHGYNLQLTIDIRIQEIADKALGNKKGAVIVSVPKTGEILAMVSKPDFDPNIFSKKVSIKEWIKLQSKSHPFLNRTISEYSPGSIFKLVSAVAALETNKLNDNTKFLSTGFLRVGGRIFYDWNRGGFGIVDIEKAIAYSIDTVFYELGISTGINNIKKYASLFNLGRLTGIKLPAESPGNVPDVVWKQSYLKQNWYIGDTVNTSIGQGYVLMTPLQAIMLINAFATDGVIMEPKLVNSILNTQNKIVKYFKPVKIQKLPLKRSTLEIIKRGLLGAAYYGTAKAISIPGVKIGAKTGTAENPPNKTHAWIIAYVPFDDPKFSIVVFLENGGSGGKDAAPIAREILKECLKLYKEGNKN